MNFVFGLINPADKKGGLFQGKKMPAEGIRVTDRTVIGAYPVVCLKLLYFCVLCKAAAAEHRADNVGLRDGR